MDKKKGTSGARISPGKKKRRRKSRLAAQKQKFIVLPAITTENALEENDCNFKQTIKASNSTSTKSIGHSKINVSDKVILGRAQPDQKSPTTDGASSKERIADHRAPETSELLPEYRSQTDGLRELLSSIDRNDDHTIHIQPPIESYHYEQPPMHLPHSASGLPGSPDLPIGPTRWGLYISGGLGALAMVFVSALVFSHITSPTGINWAKAQVKTGEAYRWLATELSSQPSLERSTIRTAANSQPESVDDILEDILDTNDTVIATASRISTTAASPRAGAIKTPTAAEIFVSPQELENQIRAFEGASGKSRKRSASARLPKSKKVAPAARPKPSGFEQLVVIPAANIDPDMENQIFSRARSYLKQRDISSARMILQYAATLGSGISAMALAETFDPNYLQKVNLNGVNGSEADARKWYYMAARLGIKEADARLTALK